MNKLLASFMLVLIFAFIIPVSADANEFENDGIVLFNVRIDVPKSFNNDIILKFKGNNKEYDYSFKLTDADNYKSMFALKTGTVYKAEYIIDGAELGKYKLLNIQETYDGKTSINYDCDLVLSDMSNDNSNIVNTSSNEKEQISISPSPNSHDEVYKEYVSLVTPILLNNSNYDSMLNVYNSDKFKEYFLDGGGTDDEWNTMNNVDTFIHYITYTYPKNILTNRNIKNENGFIELLNGTKVLLEGTNDKEWTIIYNSTKDLWGYIWDYWSVNKVIINFYEDNVYSNDEIIDVIDDIIISNDEILNDKTTNDITPIPSSIPAINNVDENVITDENENNVVLDILKNNFITLIVLVIAIIIFAVLYIKRKLDLK